MKPAALPPQTVTRIAFGVIIVFVLAQVVWWLVFQQRYIGRVGEETVANWQRDARVANSVLTRTPDDAALHAELSAAYPHLHVVAGQFVLDPAVLARFETQQRTYLRMFAFEGPFFVLVVLSGLAIIAHSLRAERELKRRQQNFLSAISHEFRTPIGTLRLLIETALYRTLSADKQRSYLEQMEHELSRLELTSEQVLASARLEQGQNPTRLAAHDLNAVVQDTLARLRPGLEARGATFNVRTSAEPLPVSLDPAAFSVVLSNLLDNAVKYTPGERKPVWVRLEADRHLLLLHVEDEGVGVLEGEMGRIFDKFYRVGNELTRETQGVGIGLYLVKSVTEAMNGWVRCESPTDPRLGRGSRFTVVLPRRVTVASAPLHAAEVQHV